MYNKKYRDQYGAMVICTEGSKNWRKVYYPEYKYKRKVDRKKSDLDWHAVYGMINTVVEEMNEFLPWYVLNVDTCEADDVIAHITLTTQEFGQHEDVMIVSSDKDFLELQAGNTNVQQFSPIAKKLIKQEDKFDLHEHICAGDSTDGVPNIMSADDVFVTGTRQTTMRKTKIEEFRDHSKMTEEQQRNYQRNKVLIDLEETPIEVVDAILLEWHSKRKSDGSRTMNYLIKKRCRNLIECVSDFANKH